MRIVVEKVDSKIDAFRVVNRYSRQTLFHTPIGLVKGLIN